MSVATPVKPELVPIEMLDLVDVRANKYPVGEVLTETKGDVKKIWPAAKKALSQRSTPHCGSFAWASLLTASPAGDRDVTPTEGFAFGEALFDEIPDYVYRRGLHSATCALGDWAVEHGYISEYRWATNMEELRDGIVNLGPAVASVRWTNNADVLGRDGRMAVRKNPNPSAWSGHVICIRGYDPKKKLEKVRGFAAYEGPAFLLRNSWGPGWALKGDCWVTWADMEFLLTRSGTMTYSNCIPVGRPRELDVPTVFANGELTKP